MKNRKTTVMIAICSVIIIAFGCMLAFSNVFHFRHSYSEWTIVQDADCLSSGEKQSVCKKCGKVRSEIIPAYGHSYKTTCLDVRCTKEGFQIHSCERCDETYVSDFVAAAGHRYSEWEITKPATCVVPGVQRQICADCGNIIEKTIDATGHSYIPVTAETIDGILCTSYQCEHCDSSISLKGEETIENVIENDVILDVGVDFSFDICSAEDEEYISRHLQIIDSYFQNSEYETDKRVLQKYCLNQKEAGVWTVIPDPSFQSDTAYTVKLSGNVSFAEYRGCELTFTTAVSDDHQDIYEFQEDILFLKSLENMFSGYYPFTLSTPENSEYMYLTVQNVGYMEIGKIICVGDIECIEQLNAENSEQCFFGKIENIYRLESGEWMVVLECPDLGELFSALDISFSDMIDFDEMAVDTDAVSEEIVHALYASDDFITFLGSVNAAATSYLTARDLDVTLLKEASFLDYIQIKPNVKLKGTKLTAIINGCINIPIQTKDKESLGNIEVSFVVDLESEFNVSLKYKLKWFIVPVGVKYFDLHLTQSDTFGFNFNINIDMTYSLSEGEEKYKINTQSGVIHRKNCRHLKNIKDTSVLRTVSPEEALHMIDSARGKECKVR